MIKNINILGIYILKTLKKLDIVYKNIFRLRGNKKLIENGFWSKLNNVGIKLASRYMFRWHILEFGSCYNIYECGCVIKNPKPYYKQFPSTGTRKICCPNCKAKEGQDPKKLITKYKICSCTNQQIGYRIVKSTTCKACYNKHAHANNTGERLKLRNGHLRDPERSDCKNYLTSCIIKFDGHDAVPCKGCNNYVIQHGNVDITDRSNCVEAI